MWHIRKDDVLKFNNREKHQLISDLVLWAVTWRKANPERKPEDDFPLSIEFCDLFVEGGKLAHFLPLKNSLDQKRKLYNEI